MYGTINSMTGRTHDVAALAALTIWVVAVPQAPITLGTLFAALLANQIGGIVPDIDQPTAPFWRNLPVGRYFGKVFGALVGGHRFLLHSLLGLFVMAGAALFLLRFLHPIIPTIDLYVVWVAFVLGMFSHLVMDSCTKEGVPWLLPIPHKFGFPPVRAWRVTTGKKLEGLVVLPGLVVLLVWLCATHYTEFAQIVQK